MKSGHPDQLGSCEEALISKGVAEKTKRWRLYILQQFLSNLNGRLHIKSYLGGGGGGEGEIRPCNSNFAYPRFEVYETFLCVFMSNFLVFMR